MLLESATQGRKIRIKGIVQGVGFRPTVWRLAQQHLILGNICNDSYGVLINAWGNDEQLDNFVDAIQTQAPPLARIDSIEQQNNTENSPSDFSISNSQSSNTHTAVTPDATTCQDCISEITDSNNRRFRYPFTNCTHCGPRFSIINAVPYDRANTSMDTFTLCEKCQVEYDDPANRRFHAQPNACSECGPKIWLSPSTSNTSQHDAIASAAKLITQGKIIAIKGIGGFHLTCDAANEEAVKLLRQRKKRYAKPFALMARNLDIITRYCHVNDSEKALLMASEAPIVLLDKKVGKTLASNVAMAQNSYGFMLPYSPIHHLLLAQCSQPIVMTSGNLSDLPQCSSNEDALEKLDGIADYFLLHDRDIVNRIDDSVVRIINGTPRLLRRARGYAPSAIPLPDGFNQATQVLAYGAELKNTFCLIKDQQAILAQHMGDLENLNTFEDYEKNLCLYRQLFDHQAQLLAIDKHPEYLSSKRGKQDSEALNIPLIEIQHHHAHIAACLAENAWPLNHKKVLGIALDGLGFGDDEQLWGGEFLLSNYQQCQRLGHFKPVALLGGAQAMHEPWRNTYAHLVSAFDWKALQQDYPNLALLDYLASKPLSTLDAMISKGINSPLASSCGRLFDAVAAAVGICRDKAYYEGQAAIELENLIDSPALYAQEKHAYTFNITHKNELALVDPLAMWQGLLRDLLAGLSINIISARFHFGLANIISDMASHLRQTQNFDHVVLSGGVMQNKFLFEQLEKRFNQLGLCVISHAQVPANDGGIALGQAVIALARQHTQEEPLCA